MKKFLFLSFLVISILFSCKKSENKSDKTNDSASTTVVVNNSENQKDTISTTQKNAECNFPEIMEIAYKKDKKTGDLFKEYCEALNSEITSEAQIKQILELQDTVRKYLEIALDDYYYDEQDYEKLQEFDKKLYNAGFLVVYAEGMYVGLEKAPILQDAINKYASEDFKLYIDFTNAYAECSGGEYPYSDLMPFYKAIWNAEKLLKKYPNSEYYKKIKPEFEYALSVVTDIHKVIFPSYNTCIVGGFYTDEYPYASNCTDWDSIIMKYPNSMFIPVIKKLRSNTSEIKYSDNLTIYVIVTDSLGLADDSYDTKKAQDKVFEYLLTGKDIVHALNIEENGKNYEYVAYRFYTDINKAEKNLKTIKSDIPNAHILKVNVSIDKVEIIR